jgi:hypothetical protein
MAELAQQAFMVNIPKNTLQPWPTPTRKKRM